MSGHQFYALCAGWLMGIVFGTSNAVSYSEMPLILIFSGVFLLFVAYFVRNARIGVVFLSAFCMLGFWHATSAVQKFDTIASSTEAVERSSVVVQIIPVDTTRTRIVLKDTEWEVYIRASLSDGVPKVGDSIVYSAKLKEPDAFVTETGRVFNYKEFSRARNVMFDTKSFEYKSVGTDWLYKKVGVLYSFRDDIAATIVHSVREPEAGLAVAMLLGIGGTLDETENRVFREVGLVHIVVLSGFHIMAIFGAMVFLCSFFLPYRMRFLVALGTTLLFSVMVGLTPTVVRADIMAICVSFAYLTGKGRSPLRALAIAACLITFLAPYALLYDAGFQFSFLATFAIIVVTPVVTLFLRAVPTTFGLRSIVAATSSIELILTPLLSWSMGTFPLIGTFANVLVLPVVPFAMLASLLLWLMSLVSGSSISFFASLVTVSHGYIISVAHVLHALPYAHFTIATYELSTLSLVYLCVATLILWLAYRRYGMPDKQKSAHSGPDVSWWKIETIGEIRARQDASRQRPS